MSRQSNGFETFENGGVNDQFSFIYTTYQNQVEQLRELNYTNQSEFAEGEKMKIYSKLRRRTMESAHLLRSKLGLPVDEDTLKAEVTPWEMSWERKEWARNGGRNGGRNERRR